MNQSQRLPREFYTRDVLEVAPELPGKYMVIKNKIEVIKLIITEVEAYRGEEDQACHAFHGRTRRTEVMYGEGGKLYMYFIYGMYWMMNIVTGEKDVPQAVLIRGAGNYTGPGKLTRALGLDRSYYGEDLVTSARVWVEDNGDRPVIKISPRIGINYCGEEWKLRPWRYYI